MGTPINVTSSNLESIAYEPDSQVLTVLFKNGSLYNYYDVPATTWESFKNAGSKGQFLASSIKGKFGYEKLG